MKMRRSGLMALHLCFLAVVVCVARESYAQVGCNGSIAEYEGGLEMLMESEVSRRFLEMGKRDISYDALKQDQPACGEAGKGQAYSRSCLPPPSNPDQGRPCSKYYRCRGGS
ncbi:hypothetical protein NMG60_11031770 [Bertholletia excelsa]